MLGQEKADSRCDAPVTLMAPGTATGVKCDPRPRQRNAMAGPGLRIMSSGGNVPRTKREISRALQSRWTTYTGGPHCDPMGDFKETNKKNTVLWVEGQPLFSQRSPQMSGLDLPESRSCPPITLPSSSEHLQIRDGSSEILRFPHPAYCRSSGKHSSVNEWQPQRNQEKEPLLLQPQVAPPWGLILPPICHCVPLAEAQSSRASTKSKMGLAQEE